jgi:hypothetical protein
MDIDHLLGLGQGLEFAPGPNANRPHTDLQGQAPIAKRQGFWGGARSQHGKTFRQGLSWRKSTAVVVDIAIAAAE